jgi:hypothetical protein
MQKTCKLQIEECGVFAHHSFTQDAQSTNPNNHVYNFYLAIVSLYYQTMLWHIACVVFLEVCNVGKVTVPKSLNIFGYLGEPNVKN